jgi:uncharacterized protein YutE (UPF0331/DUF86 family)
VIIGILPPAGLTEEQASAFVADAASSLCAMLPKARVIRIPGTDDRCIADMRAPSGVSRRYIRALASLAGVRLRKARVFLGLDRGYLTATARHRLTAALERASLSGKAT